MAAAPRPPPTPTTTAQTPRPTAATSTTTPSPPPPPSPPAQASTVASWILAAALVLFTVALAARPFLQGTALERLVLVRDSSAWVPLSLLLGVAGVTAAIASLVLLTRAGPLNRSTASVLGIAATAVGSLALAALAVVDAGALPAAVDRADDILFDRIDSVRSLGAALGIATLGVGLALAAVGQVVRPQLTPAWSATAASLGGLAGGLLTAFGFYQERAVLRVAALLWLLPAAWLMWAAARAGSPPPATQIPASGSRARGA